VRHPTRSTCLGLVVVLAAGAGLAACSSSSPTPTTTTQRATTTTYVLPPQVLTPTTIIDGQTINVPTQTNGKPIAPYNDTGGQIILTDKGILPFHLFADLGQTITWTNLCTKSVTVAALSKDFTSPAIPPGGTFTWKSDTLISERYAVSNGFQGRIDVGAFSH
jgi:hypothetical protein